MRGAPVTTEVLTSQNLTWYFTSSPAIQVQVMTCLLDHVVVANISLLRQCFASRKGVAQIPFGAAHCCAVWMPHVCCGFVLYNIPGLHKYCTIFVTFSTFLILKC
jgi:hypothetical protein